MTLVMPSNPNITDPEYSTIDETQEKDVKIAFMNANPL